MSGTLIISLDFELMWGVRDHRSASDYGDAVLGGREAIPQVLARFEAFGIHATWATVGFLFARNRDELLDYAPALRPQYSNAALSPYRAAETEIGRTESDDKLHFGHSLVQRIKDTPGQELATHTYSHYYCLEDGQTLEAFDADMQSAVAIATANGIELKSIVFPRNQMTGAHVGVCARHGVTAYRGNSGHYAYRSRSGAEQTPLTRALRLADSIAPVAGDMSYAKVTRGDEVVDIPASRFLRPHSRRMPVLGALQRRRVLHEMTHAARASRIYHLWWHPHNFGRNREANLANLDEILNHFQRLRDQFGFQSRSMREVGSHADTLLE